MAVVCYVCSNLASSTTESTLCLILVPSCTAKNSASAYCLFAWPVLCIPPSWVCLLPDIWSTRPDASYLLVLCLWSSATIVLNVVLILHGLMHFLTSIVTLFSCSCRSPDWLIEEQQPCATIRRRCWQSISVIAKIVLLIWRSYHCTCCRDGPLFRWLTSPCIVKRAACVLSLDGS